MGIGVGTAVAIGAGVSAVGAVAGAEISSSAARTAASAQEQAANTAAQTTTSMFNTANSNLSPFITTGTGATNELAYYTGQGGATLPAGTVAPTNPITGQPLGAGGFVQSFQPTTAQLEQTPGYQFTLGQGLKATQAGFAAQGLGQSGAAEAGASAYSTGLAENTYQQQLQNYWSQLQNQYNMLNTVATTGAGSAGALAGTATQTGANLSNLITGAGAASAAGTVGSANALSAGISIIGSTASNTALLYGLYNSGMFGGTVDAGSWDV